MHSFSPGFSPIIDLIFIMKKEQVRNLQDQFSTLFKTHQQSLSQQSDSNLLDSPQPSQHQNSGTFKQLPVNQSQSQDDFLDQIDDLLDNGSQDSPPTRREVMLNFKLNELRLMCKNLKQANLQLAQRIEELEKSNLTEGENTVDMNRSQDLTIMQQGFSELEEELNMYKQQLAKYQQQMEGQLALKNEEIKRTRYELGEMRTLKDKAERELKERGRTIKLLQERNQQLLLFIEELQANQEPTIGESNNDSFFNEHISHEMQTMIDKLMKELKYEKKTNAKQLSQIKRLNSQIILLENKLKEKSNKIYELELAAIKQSKPQYHNSPKGKTSRAAIDRDEQYYPSPQRNFLGVTIEADKNKNQTNFNINKNRISAQRQLVSVKQPTYGAYLPLGKMFSSFTLMDLLNKQFKIRTAEKYFIASRVVELYAEKLNHGNFDNLIPEEIQIYNFSSQNPSHLRVRANALSRSDRHEANEQSLLYNMGFILDSLLNQVQVVDSYLGTILELNIPDYIELVLGKPSKEEKQKLLIELATSIQREYLND